MEAKGPSEKGKKVSWPCEGIGNRIKKNLLTLFSLPPPPVSFLVPRTRSRAKFNPTEVKDLRVTQVRALLGPVRPPKNR